MKIYVGDDEVTLVGETKEDFEQMDRLFVKAPVLTYNHASFSPNSFQICFLKDDTRS